jgi:hypothetical protein
MGRRDDSGCRKALFLNFRSRRLHPVAMLLPACDRKRLFITTESGIQSFGLDFVHWI